MLIQNSKLNFLFHNNVQINVCDYILSMLLSHMCKYFKFKLVWAHNYFEAPEIHCTCGKKWVALALFPVILVSLNKMYTWMTYVYLLYVPENCSKLTQKSMDLN